MKISLLFFLAGALMLTWDISGHAACACSRLAGNAGALWWNANSAHIWPIIENGLAYDLFWTAWHSVSLLLMAIGWRLNGKQNADALRAPKGDDHAS